MKALTVRQPWAQLIALGVKSIETRSWSTGFRGPLAVHAGRALPPKGDLHIGDYTVMWNGDDTWGMARHRPTYDQSTWVRRLPLGAVVAVADLVDVVPMVEMFDTDAPSVIGPAGDHWWHFPADERHPDYGGRIIDDQVPYGDFTPGRYAWLLDNVRPIDPVPAKGRQGLWTPDAALAEALR